MLRFRSRITRPLLALMFLLITAASVHAADQAVITAKADRTTAKPGETITIDITLDVKAGFHAQSHTPTEATYIPFTIKPKPNPAVDWGTIHYPKGADENYPNLGTLNVYTGQVVFHVPATIKADAAGDVQLTGTARYQACNDTACFAPKSVPFEVKVTVAAGPAAVAVPATSPATAPSTAPIADAPFSDPSDTPAASPTAFGFTLGADNILLTFGVAFIAGIIFNAVPCVLPVIPLKIAGFYEAAQHDRRKCFLLGVAFSAGLVASFAVLAVLVVGLRSLTWGGLFQQTWFTVIIVGVLLVMAISQFGFFNINLPTAAYAYTPRHDTYVGNVLFGVLTAALSTPCTIGPFSGVLAWTSLVPPTTGAAAIVVVGCGMAFPYLLLSAFPQVVRRFPRTGPVGEIIKQTLAFLVLATAFFFARPFLNSVLTPPMFWWLLFAIVAVAGVFMIVRTTQAVGTPRAITLSSIAAVVVVGVSLVLTIYLSRDPYIWQPYSDQALADATKAGRPVLIDFTADWCGNCHYVEAFRLNDLAIVNAVRQGKVVMMKADVTHGTEAAVPLKDKLVPTGEIPLTAVYKPGGGEPALLKGVYSVDDLLKVLLTTQTAMN